MQGSQRAATESAIAISSLVLRSSAPSRVAACAIVEKARVVSGMSALSLASVADVVDVISR